MLRFKDVEVLYEDAIHALRGVSLEVPAGSIVALLGANGAGKTTALRACTGLLGVNRGRMTAGQITLDGRRIDGLSAPAIVRAGIGQVMEARAVFAELTVQENLRVGGYTRPRGLQRRCAEVYELFPSLRGLEDRVAGYLSGGEQQMLAIGRALMSEPRYLLLDEPSLGLAPQVVAAVGELLARINAGGTAVLLVEQNAAMALAVAGHGYVVETGRVVLDKPAAALREDDDIRRFYLGLHADGRRSLREAGHDGAGRRWSD